MILKWLVLAAIVAAVWYGFRIVARRNRARHAGSGRGSRPAGVEDLRACAECGDYVADGHRNCGRDQCPWPA